jgi:DNA-binding NtrC family response regulator
MLTAHNYKAASVRSLPDFNGYIEDRPCRAMILNLDNISVTNSLLKQIKEKNPMIDIIAVSERQFHPELEEALREYISVCLERPVDEDDLMYWLNTVFQNNGDVSGSA